MTNRFGIRTALAALAALALCAPAQAQLFRAYLASDGSDANPCTLSQPCRLMPAALAAVADGGQIWMLDSANYNTSPVVIAKSVSILAVPGAVGSLVAFPFAAVQISTGVSVSLRNLVIGPPPGGGGGAGVVISAGNLSVEHCVIANLAGRAIEASATAVVRVYETTIRQNSDGGLIFREGARGTVARVYAVGNGGAAIMGYGEATGHTIVDITDSVVEGSFSGINGSSQQFAASVTMTVANSQIVRNQYGVLGETVFSGPVIISAKNNVISNNLASGVYSAGNGVKIWAAGNTVTGNAIGLNAGAILESAGTNDVRNNTQNTSGSVTTFPRI